MVKFSNLTLANIFQRGWNHQLYRKFTQVRSVKTMMIDYDRCLVRNHFCPSCSIHVAQIVYLVVVGILCPKINLLFINSYNRGTVHIPSYPKISTVSTHPQLVVSPLIGSPACPEHLWCSGCLHQLWQVFFWSMCCWILWALFLQELWTFGFKKIHEIFEIYYSPTHTYTVRFNMLQKRNTEWTSYAMIAVSFYIFSSQHLALLHGFWSLKVPL